MTSIRRFIRLCTCTWGGRYNPIIPFLEETPERWFEVPSSKRGLDIARGYIDFFEPDLLVEAPSGMAERLGWNYDEKHFGLPRLVSINDFFEVDNRGRVGFAGAVDVFHLFADLYDKEYKFERRHKEPFVLFDPDNDSNAFLEAVWGTYPGDDPLRYILDGYRYVFDPETHPCTAETHLKLLEERYRGPLWVTRHELEESFDRSRDPVVFVFDPDDGQDVIDFWNFRLFAQGVLPLNLNWFSDSKDFLRDRIAQNYRPLPDNPSGIMIRTDVQFGRSVDEKTVTALHDANLADLPRGSFYTGRHYPRIWDETKNIERWRTRKLVVSAKSVSFDEAISEDGYAKIPALAPDFDNKARTYSRSFWMNVVRPAAGWRGDRLATVFPTNLWNPGYPRLIHGERLTITREGWVVSIEHDIGYSLVGPVNGRDAFIEWFKEHGIEAVASEEGQVADQVISVSGDLRGCGMFADKETMDLLNSMAESRPEQWRGGKKVRSKIPDRARPRNQISSLFNRREKRSWGFWAKLDYFLERSVFRAGLRVQCPNCAHYNWYDLDTIGYSLICNLCLTEFAFSQSPSDLRNVEWFYRVIGPFAAPDYARGGYAVALTLRCIWRLSRESGLTWSTGLKLSPPGREIDFAAWYRRGSIGPQPEGDEPVFMIGEAKSFGKDALTADDIETLERVGERFPGVFLIVSALKPFEDFSDNEVNLLRSLTIWGRFRRINGHPRNPVIVLTGGELFSDGYLKQVWEKRGGKAAALAGPAYIDFSDAYTLADLTQRLYLDLPSFHDDVIWLELQRLRLLGLIKRRSEVVD